MFDSGSSTNAASFHNALELAASAIPSMDAIMRGWRYPLDPGPEQIYEQQKLRYHRESSRRFVQAAGTLARAIIGGSTVPAGPLAAHFTSVEARRSDLAVRQQELFSYEFLKSILLWLDSGVGRLIEGFTRPEDMPTTSKAASRLPISESEAGSEAVDEILVPYLLQLASDRPIVNVETNRFEADTERQLFENESAAVFAFAAAVRKPFADLSSAGGEIDTQDRITACRFWASEVARGVLLNATRGLKFADVDRAFGGLGHATREATTDESRINLLHPHDEDEEVNVRTIDMTDDSGQTAVALMVDDTESQQQREGISESNDDDDAVTSDEEEEEDEEEDDETSLSESSSDPDEEDGVPNLGVPRFIYTAAFERQRLKSGVEPDVFCAKPFRNYTGHSNTRTVKDVNYFGKSVCYV